MRRTIYTMAMAAGLIGTFVQTGPLHCDIVRAARDFNAYFESLDRGPAALNTFERFLFSLMLTNTAAPESGGAASKLPPRTS